jgi:outer membrane protein OmpA-like peptidoglycan-associated protein
LDIYRSEKTPDGDWGPARNLGPVINSPLMEDSPQLTANGNIMFFSSQGHHSLGGFDFFYSEKGKKNNWSIPVNLGYPISTTDDDLFMAPVGTGDTVYYSHYRDVTPIQKSIHQLILTGEEHPELITLHGTTRLKDSKIYDDPSIIVSVVDTLSGDTIKTVLPELETGKYQIEVPPGSYKLVFQSDGYETQEHELLIGKNFATRDVALSTRLVPNQVAKGKYLAIENVYFDFDGHTILESEKVKLEKLLAIMYEFPKLEFEVIGHTDTVGSRAYNLQLSRRRANAVAQYLFGNGINEERLLTKGMGEIIAIPRQQQQQETSDLGDARFFRRVEIKILKSDSVAEIREEIALPQHMQSQYALNYTVIVLKVKERLPDGFFDQYDMEELQYIREQQAADGFVYTLGSFPQKQRAVTLAGELQERGFNDAEVVDQHELSDIVTEEIPDQGFLEMPERISEIPFYTVQIFALKEPPNPRVFRGRDDILAFECKDGFIRYCIGKIQGYSNALKALPAIQKEWYKDAFIQDYARLEKGLPPGMEE